MIERIYISRVTQDLKNAIKDCLLSVLYRKIDLIEFLKGCGSMGSDMAGINEILTKSQIVDSYFSNLSKRNDCGTMKYYTMIRSLIDWCDFDSFWFRNGKLDSSNAKRSIERLKELSGKKTQKEDERLRKKRKRGRG